MTIGSNEIEKLLTSEDLMKIFAISKTTVYRMINGRKIPFYKINGGVRFRAEDVKKYIEKNRFELIE